MIHTERTAISEWKGEKEVGERRRETYGGQSVLDLRNAFALEEGHAREEPADRHYEHVHQSEAQHIVIMKK